MRQAIVFTGQSATSGTDIHHNHIITMKLTLHGTGAGTPGADRTASALTASFSDGSHVLFDAGDGCVRSLLRDRIDLHRIEAVAISHLHADHWGGLPALVQAWGVFDREAPVTIYVPPGTVEFFRTVQRHGYSFSEKQRFTIHYRVLNAFEMRDGWSVETFATTHLKKVRELAEKYELPTEALGYILRNGDRKIVLSQDIGGEDDLKDVIEGAELLICESAHVDPRTVLVMARSGGVQRVIFTHVPPEGAEWPEKFEGMKWGVAGEGEMVEV
jgi:ribonuclease BN (tRNA processing enzyme)